MGRRAVILVAAAVAAGAWGRGRPPSAGEDRVGGPPRGTTAPARAATRPAGWPSAAEAPLAGPPRRATRPAKVRKFLPPTPEQVAAFRRRAEALADRAAPFAPRMHRVETAHFLIYSTWDPGNDRALGDVCENFYAAIRRQFDIGPRECVWAGKCPVYVFRRKDAYRRFSTEVCPAGLPDAAGYCVWFADGFVVIVMGPSRSRTWFYEVLVHEATHGFLSRYRTNRDLPAWVQEGVADTMAARLVKGSWARRKYVDATREAVTGGRAVEGVFDEVGPEAFDYGIAQSLVRFLLARDREAFVRFIEGMKAGRTEAEALKASFGLTRKELVRQWRRAAERALKRRGRR